MNYTIQNEHLTAKISSQGAELQSLTTGGTQLLWQGDPQWWAGRAPVLFPAIGKLKGGAYTHEGKQYTLQNHGFARRSEFTLAKETADAVTLSLQDNEETRKAYPFAFELQVTYKLTNRTLHTIFQVKNKSQTDIHFAIGGHPAFNCPLTPGETFEDYEIAFNEKETAGTQIITEEGTVSEETTPFLDETNKIPLTHGLFEKYKTLVFTGLKSTQATLQSRKTGASVTVDFSGCEQFAIWQPPGAPFICLEPWQGIDTSPTPPGALRNKTGTIKLAKGATHKMQYYSTNNAC